MRRIIKPLSIFTVTAVIGLSAIQAAWADTSDDPDTPPTVAITKLLQVPTGTTVPDGAFEFNVVLTQVDDVTDNPIGPALGLNNLTGDYPDVVSIPTSTPSLDTTTSMDPDPTGTDTYYMESPDLLNGATFPHAGVYTYSVTEIGFDDGVTKDTWPDGIPRGLMKYSKAEYTLTVYVDNGANGLVVDKVIAEQLQNDDGGDAVTIGPDEQTSYPKVDPTQGGPVGNEESKYSELAFTNAYVQTSNNADPTKPTLSISNTVTGSYADKTRLFDFTVTLHDPSNLAQVDASVSLVPPFYLAYIVDTSTLDYPSGDMTDPGPLGNDDSSSTSVEVSTSAETTFQLKDGQSLVFVNTPVGLGYTATVNNPTGYIPSYSVTTDNTTQLVPTTGTVSTTLGTSTQLAGERTNSAAFTNTRDVIAVTGLTMDNLPFVGLLGLIALGMVGYIGLRMRLRARVNS